MTNKVFNEEIEGFKKYNPTLPIVSAIGGKEYYVRNGIQRLQSSDGKNHIIIRATEEIRGIYTDMDTFYSDFKRAYENLNGSVFVRFDYKDKFNSISSVSVGNSDWAPIPTPNNWPKLFKIWAGDRSYNIN